MFALLLLLAAAPFQKPAPQKPAKPAKPPATKPAEKPAAKAPEKLVAVTLERLAPENSAVVFVAPSLGALERATAPARAWLGPPLKFVELLTGLALPAGALDATRPLLLAGAVEGKSDWTWTIAGTATAGATSSELPAPWRRLDVSGFAVWTQRADLVPAKTSATAAIAPDVGLSVRVDVRHAGPVLDGVRKTIEAIRDALAPSSELPGPYGSAPRVIASAFIHAFGTSMHGTFDVRDGEILWTGVPNPRAKLGPLGAGEPRDLGALARWIDPGAQSWFVGRVDPGAPLAGALVAIDHGFGLGGGRPLPDVDGKLLAGAFGAAVAIGRSLRGAAAMDRLVLEGGDPATVAARIDAQLFTGVADVADAQVETKPCPGGEVRSARIPIDTRSIEFLDPGNAAKSAELLLLRVRTLKQLNGGNDVHRVRAIRDGSVVALLGAVAATDAAQLVAPLPAAPRADVAAAIAELKGYPGGFASSTDLGAQIALTRALFESGREGDPEFARLMADKIAGPVPPPGKLVVTQLGGIGPDALFLRVRADFALLLAPLGADRTKRVARNEWGELRRTPEHVKISGDLEMLWGAASAYRDNNERWPATLADLGKPDAQGLTYLVGDVLPVDPWGRPYAYRAEGKQVVVSTLGADGEKGGTGLDTDVEKVMN